MTGWEGGGTRAWRKVRAYVLDRDGWRCRLCGLPISRAIKYPHPKSASVHHTRGKRNGDDPKDLVATHLDCNQNAGTITATPDPEPRSRTEW